MTYGVESGPLQRFSERRNQRLQTVVYVLFGAVLTGMIVSLPSLIYDAQNLTNQLAYVAQTTMASLFGMCIFLIKRGRFDWARVLMFGACTLYALCLMLMYDPGKLAPLGNTLYVTVSALIFATNLISVIVLDVWERARFWLLVQFVTYALGASFLFVTYRHLFERPYVFVILAVICLLMFVCVAALARTFTFDLNDLLAQSEQSRAQEIVHREQSEALRDEALQANRSKSQFLANMSHELRTPLNAILGYVELIREEADELELSRFDEDLLRVHVAASHLHGLINDVLDLSKIEAGKLELIIAPIALEPLIRELESTIAPLCLKNENAFRIHAPRATITFLGDEVRLRQILLNLLSNAAKFTQEGQITLRVWLEEAAHTLCFEVRDSGIGIPQEKLKQIFEPFEQVDGSTTRKYGGTGLGLPISSRLAQMMGGQILVHSSPGQGASFTLKLPYQMARAEEEGSVAT